MVAASYQSFGSCKEADDLDAALRSYLDELGIVDLKMRFGTIWT